MRQPKDMKDHLAENISHLMDERGIKPQSLAKASGMGYRSVYRVIRAEGNPTLDLLSAIADGLKVPLWILFLDKRLSLSDARMTAGLVGKFYALSPENRDLAINMISALSGDNTLAAPSPKDKARNTAA